MLQRGLRYGGWLLRLASHIKTVPTGCDCSSRPSFICSIARPSSTLRPKIPSPIASFPLGACAPAPRRVPVHHATALTTSKNIDPLDPPANPAFYHFQTVIGSSIGICFQSLAPPAIKSTVGTRRVPCTSARNQHTRIPTSHPRPTWAVCVPATVPHPLTSCWTCLVSVCVQPSKANSASPEPAYHITPHLSAHHSRPPTLHIIIPLLSSLPSQPPSSVMAKKASRSSSKGPALRQRRSGASSSSVGESTKRAAASGKKINPITGQRQPKQPPRKLAVGNCANCGCSQMDTCLWRTHPSPDADGGKVKLCNACGIHIRDKGYNRKVTPEMLQRQSSQAQATRRAWAIQNGHESDSDIPSSPTSSEFSDDGAPPSPAASDSTKAATPTPSPLPAVPAMPTSSSAGPAVRKNSLKASPKASPKSLKSKAARKASKAARPAPLKLTKSAFDTSSNLPSPTSDASDAPLRKKEVSIRPKPVSTMSDEEAADALFRLISDAWRQYDGCSVHSSASDDASCCSGSSEADTNTQASSSSCIDTDSQPSFHTQLPPPIFPGDVFYPTPGPEKSFHGFGAYQNYEAPAYVRRDSLESATTAASANIMTPPVTPVLYANNGCTEKGYPPEGYGADLATDHFFAH